MFKFEVKEDFQRAVDIAKSAFEESLKCFAELDHLRQEETLQAMILLEDNMKLWDKDLENQQNKDELIKLNEIKSKKLAEKVGKSKKLEDEVSFD
jgi:hypothetical protein